MLTALTPSVPTRNVRILEDDEIRKIAPSVFAERPWQDMTAKYQFIPTSDVLTRMRDEGFYPVKVSQSRCRIEGKGDYTKHMIRFRQAGAELVLNEVFPEIVLVNSHDGASSFQCYAGLFRLACLNGMVASLGVGNEYRTRHSGHVDNVVDAAYRVVRDFPQLIESVQTWQAVTLNEREQLAYAEAARELRWETSEAPVSPDKLLLPRRRDDVGNSLWVTFQRVQENLSKGGLRYERRSPLGRLESRNRTRPVIGVDGDIKLNRALWTLTHKMSELVPA